MASRVTSCAGCSGRCWSRTGVEFVKGSFRRPFAGESAESPAGGGRVTELMARPLFSAFYPDLAAFAQPLAGEVAARRGVFERLPFACGYAIETSMLLHARDLVGIEAMAQVDLDERRNHHQSLEQLGPMSYAVLRRDPGAPARARAACSTTRRPPFQAADGRLVQVELVERPPFASLRAPAQ